MSFKPWLPAVDGVRSHHSWNWPKNMGRQTRIMKKHGKKAARFRKVELDALIEEITVDADGDAEQIWALREAFEDNIALPGQGFVMGAPVSVIAFDFDGNERRGLTAKCRGADGRKHTVSAADVSMAPGSSGARYVAAYRKWMGLTPYRRHRLPQQARAGLRAKTAASILRDMLSCWCCR